MRRLVCIIALLITLPLYIFADQPLKQSTATQLTLKFVDATDGVTAETALDVTTFDCNFVKHADSGMTATAITVTASGGANDSGHLGDGIYSLEATATDTNTPGRLDLYCQCSGAAPFEGHYEVLAAEVYTARISDISSVDDFWEHPTSSIGVAGSIGLQLKTNADVPTSQYSMIKNRTTIATLASQTSFTLTAGSADNNAYVNWLIFIQDDSVGEQIAAGVVSAYTGATKTVTLLFNPAIFTMAVGDIVYLVPDVPGAAADAGVIWDTTLPELSQATPPAVPSARNALMMLYMSLRNKYVEDAATKKFYNDAGTVIYKKDRSASGSVKTDAEAVAGP